MEHSTIEFEQEQPQHQIAIENLLDKAFGPGRFAKTAERLREGNHPVKELCMVVFEGAELRASVKFWPIILGKTEALLLGPLAVDPDHRGRGIGLALMRETLNRAKAMGHELVLLVGDEPYYQKVGFKRVPPGNLIMPGPVELNRVLICELNDGAAKDVFGQVQRQRKQG